MGLLPVREPQYKAIRDWVVLMGDVSLFSVIFTILFIQFIFTLSFSLSLSRLNDFYDSLMHTFHTSFSVNFRKNYQDHAYKNDEFHRNLAYTENPFINLCTSMSSGCCRSALFFFPIKNVLATCADLLDFKFHHNTANFAEESAQ